MKDAPKDDDFVFVEVTKTFMMSKAQARKMVSVSRLIHSDRTFFHGMMMERRLERLARTS
jgi:hypothetical protein